MHALLIDVTKCTGCERCVTACVTANALDPHRADADRATSRDGLSAERPSTVLRIDADRWARKSCMHCLEPSCVSACLVGAFEKTPEGPVVYDPARCIGCRYCMLACPFHVPRYTWDDTAPVVRKCTLCSDRTRDGGSPACADACPAEAITFGDRDSLLAEARARLLAEPGRYIDRIWGETEFGGTSVLYLSDVDLDALGWPAPAQAAIPALTEPLVEATPFVGLGVAAGLMGIHWIVRRRMRLAAEELASLPGEDGREVSDDG